MERWMYLPENVTADRLNAFVLHLRNEGISPLSLRELLRSKDEKACGILLKDVSEKELPGILAIATAQSIPISLACGNRYSPETLHILSRVPEITLLSEASYLLSAARVGEVVKAQAVYLDLPWTKELQALLRTCHTRVLVTKDTTLRPAITSSGIYCLGAIRTGETPQNASSAEITLEKHPLFTSYPLAPRLALLRSNEELLSCTYTRSYHSPSDDYRISAHIPFVTEAERELPPDPETAFSKALEQNYGILLHQNNKETFFLYGIQGDTDCFSAFDSHWNPVLINRSSTEIFRKTRSVTLLRYTPGKTEPDGEIFSHALKEEEAPTGECFSGRTAAVRYLNAFSTEETPRDSLSLQVFLEERLLIGEALQWFASKESLYVDHLEHHLSQLEICVPSILEALRKVACEITPSRRLQWGDSLHHLFASEEICLRQCIEERQRMATYRLWAAEFRKKS